jgi:positive regulator of sigma E activity
LLEEGIVKVVSGKRAHCQLDRKGACGCCLACAPPGSGEVSLEADNRIGAEVGDRVRLHVETKGVFWGISALYLFPAVGLIVGIILGNTIAARSSLRMDPDNAGILFGTGLMLLFFLIGRLYGRKKVKYSASILEILDK